MAVNLKTGLRKRVEETPGQLNPETLRRIQELIRAIAMGEVKGVIISWEDREGCSHNALEGSGHSLSFLTDGIVQSMCDTFGGAPQGEGEGEVRH